MKGFKKILALGSAIGVMSSPLAALEVYNEDDKKLEIYGSIRAYYGVGGHTSSSVNSSESSFGAIYGPQTNSRLGVKMTFGKVSATAELGAEEPSVLTESGSHVNFRHLWASYNFGSGGKILFGKTDTPSVSNAMFMSDVLNTDQGAAGFGAIVTAKRKFQIRYSIAGIDIALVADDANIVANANYGDSSTPRISASWTHKDKDKGLDIKVGGSYKYYTASSKEVKDPTSIDYIEGASNNAFHIFAALKTKLSDNQYVSGMVHYGMNAANYGEQYSSISYGAYSHTKFYGSSGHDTHRVGVYAEATNELSKALKLVVGLGYQATLYDNVFANTYMIMAQLPYKIDKHITITPQVGWYALAANQAISGIENNNAFVGVVRFNYTF